MSFALQAGWAYRSDVDEWECYIAPSFTNEKASGAGGEEMLKTETQDFAILAPIPLEHLASGKEIAEQKGFVAFGSTKWDFFQKVNELRKGSKVPVLVYPSREDVRAKASFIVSWFGWYIGSENSQHGKHPLDMEHRPQTTRAHERDNRGHWSIFWHVEGLRELPLDQRIPISSIETVKGGWRKGALPRGPERVALPYERLRGVL
jgi:hypothetical protein